MTFHFCINFIQQPWLIGAFILIFLSCSFIIWEKQSSSATVHGSISKSFCLVFVSVLKKVLQLESRHQILCSLINQKTLVWVKKFGLCIWGEETDEDFGTQQSIQNEEDSKPNRNILKTLGNFLEHLGVAKTNLKCFRFSCFRGSTFLVRICWSSKNMKNWIGYLELF